MSKGKNVKQALFSSGVARGGRGGGRGGSRFGGRGSNRNNSRSRNKGTANVGTSEGSEGSEGRNNPPAHKQTIPQTEYNKVKCKCIRCLEPGHMWYQCKARVIRLRRGRVAGMHRDRTTAVRLCAVLRMRCLVVVMTHVLWIAGIA